MDSSDDENEGLPEFVSNYYFLNDDGEPVSFSVLPICWNANETMQSRKLQIDLHGTTDGGLQKFYKRVKAWKFDISGEEPDILVLSIDNNWLKVKKPRKSYQETVRSELITVNFLHLVKKDPGMSRKAIGSRLSRIFSLYDAKPSQKDLLCHKILIEEAVKQDESLKQSEYLVMLLEKKQQRVDEYASTEEKREFIVDDDGEEDEEEDASSEEEDGDSEEGEEKDVCCICDNGGILLCCAGVCMRSFHATQKAAEDAQSECDSLGLTEREVKEIPNFTCKNCQYKQHQCYSCGMLGSSDKSSGAEVFQCVNATCGYFYHPRCAAKLLHRDNIVAAKELQKKILEGESFTCPLHTCFVCKEPEDKTISELQMAVCRRCPRAYHEKCLPKDIAFEDEEDERIIPRAWRGLLADRILIYCLEHEIDEDLGTPARDHIKFPSDEKRQSSVPVLSKDSLVLKKKKLSIGVTPQSGTAVESKKKSVLGNLDKKTDIKSLKVKVSDTSNKTSTEKRPGLKKKSASSVVEKNTFSLGNELLIAYRQQGDLLKPRKSEKVDEAELSKTSIPAIQSLEPQLDSDSEASILELMKEASSIITMDDIIVKHAYKQRMDLKNITLGKVQGSCKAVQEARNKLDKGGSIEDAKNICDSKALSQMAKWKSKLKIYLSPFLYGMRYTSYGRHFTKIDKLKEIVEKIHWYVNRGDTVVDFCCGANDFSLLMKQKLEQTGKRCSYKNYDLFRPKNDFCFEKRDWLETNSKDLKLPTGSQLIMGLNPPFGVRAALANQFIDKALEFKPKLLILIVPPETERLDQKETPYDLIWEDVDKLSGKSFYLPGSVDVNDQQMEDWNKVAPVLYLWSRSDWTATHKTIAQKHRHLLTESKPTRHSPMTSHDQRDAMLTEVDLPVAVAPVEIKGVAGRATEDLETQSAQGGREGQKSERNLSNKRSTKRKNHEKQQQKRNIEKFPERKQRQLSPSPHPVRPRLSSPKPQNDAPGSSNLVNPILDGRRSQEHHPSIHRQTPSDMEIDYPSYVPPVECTTQPTSYDDALQKVDPTVEAYEPTSYGGAAYGRVHDMPHQMVYDDAAVYGRTHDTYQPSYYQERADPYTGQEADPFASRRESWLMEDAIRQPSYMREPQDYHFNQPSQSEAELRHRPSTYSMGSSTYSRMNNMPVTERYSLRLDDRNHSQVGEITPLMGRDAGGGLYDYHGPIPRHDDNMGFARGPVNYYPPNSAPRGGWLHD